MIPRTGVLLDGRYELTRRIAVGGMGEVWAATEVRSGREVAAKVLRPEFAGEQLFLDRLAAEARNSSTLSHPGIAHTWAHGEVDGLGYLVMDLVAGEPLSDVLARERTLSPRRVLEILSQTADALATAHDARVVHRDIKPANLIVTPAGTITITDFGISLGADQAPMTDAGMVMGTAQYLPPEQAMGRAATGAGDIYALGIIAYEALVGRRPYTGSTQVDIAFAHVTEPLPPLPGTIDLPLRSLVEQMLAKDPAHRPASARVVAQRARALLAELDSGSWDPRVMVGAWRWPHTTAGDSVRDSAPDSTPAHRERPRASAATPSWPPPVVRAVPRHVVTALAIVIVVALVTIALLVLGNLGESAALADADLAVGAMRVEVR